MLHLQKSFAFSFRRRVMPASLAANMPFACVLQSVHERRILACLPSSIASGESHRAEVCGLLQLSNCRRTTKSNSSICNAKLLGRTLCFHSNPATKGASQDTVTVCRGSRQNHCMQPKLIYSACTLSSERACAPQLCLLMTGTAPESYK